VYDNVSPTSTITMPVNALYYRVLPDISGTAYDGTAGVNSVRLYIKDNNTGNYFGWSGSQWNFGLGSVNWLPPSGGTVVDWTYTGYAAQLTDGHSYTVVTKSSDNAFPTNDETFYTVGKNTMTFIYDTNLPTATVTLPNLQFASTLPLISGTARDSLSDIGSVEIAIQDLSQGVTWYNGSGGWKDSGSPWIAVSTAPGNPPTWSYNSTLVPWSQPKQYRIFARAKDNAVDATTPSNPNMQVVYSSVTVTFDLEKPTAAVTYPNYGGSNIINTIPVITGTAVDWPAGIDQQNVFCGDKRS